MATNESNTSDIEKYVNLSNSDADSDGEQFVLPRQLRLGKSTYNPLRSA